MLYPLVSIVMYLSIRTAPCFSNFLCFIVGLIQGSYWTFRTLILDTTTSVSFSGIFTGDIFEEKVIINGETIKSSRYNELWRAFFEVMSYFCCYRKLNCISCCSGGLVLDLMQTQCSLWKIKTTCQPILQKPQVMFQMGNIK